MDFLKVLFLFCATLFLNQKMLSQVDNRIDQNPNKHKHSLTFTRHVNSPFTATKAINALKYGTSILQKCDNNTSADQDVACQVEFALSGSINTFDNTDAVDVITTEAEMNALLAINSARVKVVSMIMTCGGTMGNILGCAPRPGNSIAIINSLDDNTTGETLVHEFGHNQGLHHRNTPGMPIMHATALGQNEVNQTEAAAFHQGGTVVGPYRPVTVSFVIDNTGSMGEEIAGVRDAILKVLTNYSSNSCGEIFQLITFKDDVAIGTPTTDLSVIQSQVSALTASGGGDCPEASIEALSAALDLVNDGGTVFIATDADPKSSASSAASKAKARKITVNTILSGSCTSTGTLASETLTLNTDLVPYSNNSNGATMEGASISNLASLNAIETFSFLAEETGGIFKFYPQVNSGNPDDKLFFENLFFNLLQGVLFEAIISAEPSSAPRGSTLAIKIQAFNSDFDANTTVTFSGTGITVVGTKLVSKTEIDAVLTIDVNANLGFRDAVVTTPIDGDDPEIVKGVGIFKIINATAVPAILSILPSSGIQGQTIRATIYGVNTNFDETSVISMGNGITFSNTVAISPTILETDLMIGRNAATGFRNIVVNTGTEVATENLTGPFLVILKDRITCDGECEKPILVNSCNCRETVRDRLGNIVRFVEKLTIVAPSGIKWQIASQNGLLDKDGIVLPTGIDSEVLFTEDSATPGNGFSTYTLNFQHNPENGFSATITDGIENFSVSNSCKAEDCATDASAVPTLSEWGAFLMILLVLSLGLITVFNVTVSNQIVGNSEIKLVVDFFPFHTALFKEMLISISKWSIIPAFMLIYLGWGEIVFLDFFGVSLALLFISYFVHLMKIMNSIKS